jgi:tetratricopeptide (TPR) repeat protein
MRARLCPILLILAILSLVSACRAPAPPQPPGPSSAVIYVDPKDRKPAEEPAEKPAEKPAEEPATAVRQKIRQQLAVDNYSAALVLVLGSGLSEEEVAEEYERAIKGVLKQAEGYREKDMPEKAGPLYRAALDGYPKSAAVAARVETRPAGISTGIETCADQLMERGLAAYRSGDLDQAIKTWKLIHVFAPQHQSSRKALETAEVQLNNLKKVRSEK